MPNYAATNTKKFLDAEGLRHFSERLNNYPDNTVIEAVIEGVQDALEEKLDVSLKGTPQGLAELDETGKLESSQMPSIITEIQMNGTSMGTEGVINLGTVITSHQDISGKADKSNTVTNVSYTNKKFQKTINTTTTDIVSISTIKQDLSLSKSDVGLDNVDNTSDADKPVSTATQNALNTKLNTSLKGAPNGIAELDENGHVPSSQLPSYVDDVLEYNGTSNFPLTGTSGIIYVDISNNKTYRWSGSAYVEISASLALGETSATAYYGDKGKTAYTHATDANRLTTATASGLYKIAVTAEGHVSSATSVVKNDITSLGIPAQDTTYVFDGTYNSSTNKAATVSTVNNAIEALDGGTIGTPGEGKTLTALSQTNGNISATFGDISISKSQVKDFPSLGTASSHNIDSSITAGSSSENLPTSAAVASFVEGKGYVVTSGVTNVSTGIGLAGGPISSTGTIKAKLKSETAHTADSAALTNEASRQYAVGVDKSGYLSVNVPWENTHTITGVKGNSESSYRTGNVNITAANVGAVALSQGTNNAGKFLIVNSSGNVEAISMSVWQGGSY